MENSAGGVGLSGILSAVRITAKMGLGGAAVIHHGTEQDGYDYVSFGYHFYSQYLGET